MRVVLLHDQVSEDSPPDHRDVLVQAREVSTALAGLGYDPIQVTFSLDLREVIETLRDIGPAFIFNLVESVGGQGRLIHMAPALLDHLQIPYTGSDTDALYLTSHKIISKTFLSGSGISTPEGLTVRKIRKGGSFSEGWYILKSLWEHASAGIEEDSVVFAKDWMDLLARLENHRRRLGMDCFAESYIDGREFNLSLLASPGGPEVLPPAEIRFDAFPPGKKRLVGYRAKWEEDSFEYRHTPRGFRYFPEDASLIQKISHMAKSCWTLFGLRGYARVDFRVDEEGRPWVLEINTNPCLSSDAGFMAAAREAGLDLHKVVERIVDDTVSDGS